MREPVHIQYSKKTYSFFLLLSVLIFFLFQRHPEILMAPIFTKAVVRESASVATAANRPSHAHMTEPGQGHNPPSTGDDPQPSAAQLGCLLIYLLRLICYVET